ncbi:helix-turn-helix domain-containing protein [Streptomyces sp. NPDC057580]|uniref:helix-turn-helix domain-containing protein n=1 Tax=Streptomyces sp. NPDC057580 TaxID=3346173 RepID=UPI00369524BA
MNHQEFRVRRRKAWVMEEIGAGLERLLYTQPVPSTTASRLRVLLRWARGSTRQVAAVLGVSQRTVQRWVTRKAGGSRRPSARHEEAIADLVRARWQPRVRARRRAEAEEHGVVVHARCEVAYDCHWTASSPVIDRAAPDCHLQQAAVPRELQLLFRPWR